MTTDVLVLSVATEETAYFPALRASAGSQGFRFEVLGMGRQWGGFIWANSLILERAQQCEPDQLVLVLDGYDTIITAHREDSQNIPKGMFSCERARGTHANIAHRKVGRCWN